MPQVVLQAVDLLLELQHRSLVAREVEAQDTRHADLQKTLEVGLRDGAQQLLGEGLQAPRHMRQRQCLTLRVFEFPILIDTLLDEDPLQRSGQVLLLTLAEQDL